MRTRNPNAIQAPIRPYAGIPRRPARTDEPSELEWIGMRLLCGLAALPHAFYLAVAAVLFAIGVQAGFNAGFEGMNIKITLCAVAIALFLLMTALNIYTLCIWDPLPGPTGIAAVLGSAWFGFLCWYFWPFQAGFETRLLLLVLSPQAIALGRQLVLLRSMFAAPLDEFRAFLSEVAREYSRK